MFRRILLLVLVLGLAGCGAAESMQGHASENGGGGRIRLGLPF